ncbi:MAG: L,D-transpeptidase family protein [Nakamurella sp.]
MAAKGSASAHQIVTVAASSAGSTYATLSAWQRNSDGSWTRKFGPVAARVGQQGIGQALEGSEFTPAGSFPLDQAFGRLANPGTKLPYFSVDTRDWWDENPSSPTYNLHVRQVNSPGGASENLYNAGTAYNLAVNIAYNPTRIPGKGSAFFLHVGTGSPTAGCVSIDQPTLQAIMRWLDPAQHPVIDIRNGAAYVPKTRRP